MAQETQMTEDIYPLPNLPTADDVLAAVRDILMRPGVEQIVVEPGKPIRVRWFKPSGMTLVSPPDNLSVEDVVNRIELQEIQYDREMPAMDFVVRAMLSVQARGLYPGYVVLGANSKIRDWLCIPGHYPMYGHLCGAQVVVDTEYPDYTFVVLGVPIKGARLSDAVFGVRVAMEV